MPIHRRTLDELEFTHTHTVFMAGEQPDFRAVRTIREDASVYMWVSPTDVVDEFEVLYVGKAGYGIRRRLRQHRGGFINSGVGRKNARSIAEWIARGRSVMVFARISATQRVFGMDVSLYSAEEHALYERFPPRLNRASFPRVVKAQASPHEKVLARPVAPHSSDFPVFNEVADGDEIAAFYGSLSADKQAQFAQLVALIEQRDPEAGQKVVAGYSEQPRGYSAKPTLVFGKIGRGERARNIVGRIPLVDGEDLPLTVTFPESARVTDLDASLYSAGRSGSWRPLDLVHFLQNPQTYLR